MLKQLQQVRPSIGSVQLWKRHENKNNQVRELRKAGDVGLGKNQMYKMNTQSLMRFTSNENEFNPVLAESTNYSTSYPDRLGISR